MARKQELALEQQQLQAALDAGAASGIDPLDQPSIQPDIKVKQMVVDTTFSAVLRTEHSPNKLYALPVWTTALTQALASANTLGWSFPGASLQEALFQLQLSQAEAGARHSTGLVGGKDGAHVGSTPPTPDELASMAAARAAVLQELEAHKQQAAVHR